MTDDTVFGVTTVFHVFGLGVGILGTVQAGACLVLQDQFQPADAQIVSPTLIGALAADRVAQLRLQLVPSRGLLKQLAVDHE